MRFAGALLLVCSLWACAPQVAVPAQAPPPVADTPRSEWKDAPAAGKKKPAVPEPVGVPPADAACQAFATHSSDGCGKVASEGEALAQALVEAEPLERDARLACLENSASLPAGLIRALRAERAPIACADVLALPFLEPRRPELDRSIEDTLVALATGGRLARLVQKPPELPTPFDKPHFTEFFQGTLKPWVVNQAQAIFELALAGQQRAPYARGVIAIEAGLADMRFVSVVRQVALPKEMSDDAGVRDAYYAALDEALEPRKARGRDAALVGLRELANEGVLTDARVDRARALLSEVYAGRRIDSLDKLLLPELPALPTATTEQRLAASLPTFYANFLLANVKLDNAQLRVWLERGIPRSSAARIDPAKLDDAGRDLLARAVLQRGLRYFRSDDFTTCAALTAGDKQSPERALYHALASALQNGPRDASDLLLRGAQPSVGPLQVAELDRLASEKGNPHAALAAFDAAYLLGLAPAQNDPKFWDGLSQRFEKAQRQLRDPVQKKRAADSAAAAKDTAKALRATRAQQR